MRHDMTSPRSLAPYWPPYLVGLSTFSWYQLLIFGPFRHVVGVTGIAACFALCLFMRKRGASLLLCVPALVLAGWDYLVLGVMVAWWSVVGFAP